MEEIIERVVSFSLQEVTELHVASDVKVAVVLFLDGAHKRVVALVTELAVVIAGAVSFHSCGISSHGKGVKKVGYRTK